MDRIAEIQQKIKGGVIIDSKSHLIEFKEWDREVIKDIQNVFAKHGFSGVVTGLQVTVDCGMSAQKPRRSGCFRDCQSGPDDAPICTWVCP